MAMQAGILEDQVNLSITNSTLKNALEYLGAQANVSIIYSTDILNDKIIVSLNNENITLEDALTALLANENCSFRVEDGQVVIYKLSKMGPTPISAQSKSDLIGIVTDSKTGESIIGASVLIKGTLQGISTDFDGKFSISCDPSNVLVISYIGYETREIKVGNQKMITIELREDAKALEEVVITAFGTGQKKASMVGSVQTISPRELKVPSANLSNSFAGRLAGVVAVQRGGEPGADGSNFWIRGISTFGGSADPLIILDGVQVSSGDLNAVDPEVIEGFSILKDATATAMYGTRGANGVMIVTTKSGQNLDKPIINFRLEGSISRPTKIPEFVDGASFMELFNEAITNVPAGKIPYTQDRIDGTRQGLNEYVYPNVDWYDEVFKNQAFNQNFNFNIRGGGKKVDYFSSISVNHETGMLQNRSKDFFSYNNNIDVMRYAFQNNINAYLSESSKLSLRLNVQLRDMRGPKKNANDLFKSVMNMNPVDMPVMYPPDGVTDFIKWGASAGAIEGIDTNPVAELATGYNDSFENTVIAALDFEQKLDFVTEGLKFKALASFKNYGNSVSSRTAGWNKFSMNQYQLNDDGTYDYTLDRIGDEVSTVLGTSSTNNGDRRIYLQAMIDYSRTFGEHDVNAMFVYNQDEYVNNNPGDALLKALPKRKQGIAARASYAFDNKYLAEVNLGYNGSENFAKGNRFGFFPSVAVGYNISQEKYFEPLSNVFSNFKVRVSYGLVGNDQIGDERFIYLSDVNLQGAGFTSGLNQDYTQNGPVYNRYMNNNITWEVGRKFDVGLDMQLWNALNITVDGFQEYRTNIFQEKGTIPTYLGMSGSKVYGNYAEVKNYGFDASLDYGRVFNKDLTLTFKGTFTFARNKITKYEESVGNNTHLSYIGQSINSYLGYVSNGLFIDYADVANSPTQLIGGTIGPGDIKYEDIADRLGYSNGKIDENDRRFMGNPKVPEIVYGFGPSLQFKNWDVSLFFQGVAKTSLMMSDFHPFGNVNYNRNVLKYVADDRWSPTNQNIDAAYPRLTIEDSANNSKGSSFWLRDGSFLKLKNAEIGYTLKGMRFYLSGSNLLTFSSFKHWDPEMGEGNGLKYPTQRVFNIGFQMTLK
jgi:TonB-linked SusC/RagA family outer membrane protein